MRIMITVTAAALVVGGCSMMKGKEDKSGETKIAASDLPAAVKQAMDTRLPGATVRSAVKENEAGNVVYDLEMTQNGRKFEMDVKEDGTVMEVEKEVKTADLPAAVAQGVKTNFPSATVTEAMEVDKVSGNQETLDHYEVTLSGAKEKEVNFSADGKVMKEE